MLPQDDHCGSVKPVSNAVLTASGLNGETDGLTIRVDYALDLGENLPNQTPFSPVTKSFPCKVRSVGIERRALQRPRPECVRYSGLAACSRPESETCELDHIHASLGQRLREDNSSRPACMVPVVPAE